MASHAVAMTAACRHCIAAAASPSLLSRPRPRWITSHRTTSPQARPFSHASLPLARDAPKTDAQERAIRIRETAKRKERKQQLLTAGLVALRQQQERVKQQALAKEKKKRTRHLVDEEFLKGVPGRPENVSKPLKIGRKFGRTGDREARFHLSFELRRLQALANERPLVKGAYGANFIKAERLFAAALPSHRRHVIVYNQMIYLAFAANKGKRALELVQEMKKDGVFPNCYTMSTVCRGLVAKQLNDGPLLSPGAKAQVRTLGSDLRTLQPQSSGAMDIVLDDEETSSRHVTPSRLRASRQEAQLEATLQPRSFDVAACAYVEALTIMNDFEGAWAWLTGVGHADKRGPGMRSSPSPSRGGMTNEQDRAPLIDQLTAAFVKACATKSKLDEILVERLRRIWTSVDKGERAALPSLDIAEQMLALATKKKVDLGMADLIKPVIEFVIDHLEQAKAQPRGVMPHPSLLRSAMEQLRIEADPAAREARAKAANATTDDVASERAASEARAKLQRLKQGLADVLGDNRIRNKPEPERVNYGKTALMTLVQDGSSDVEAAEKALSVARAGAQATEADRWMPLYSMAMLVVARARDWGAALRLLEARAEMMATGQAPKDRDQRTTQSDTLFVLRALEAALGGQEGQRLTPSGARNAMGSVLDLCGDTALVRALFHPQILPASEPPLDEEGGAEGGEGAAGDVAERPRPVLPPDEAGLTKVLSLLEQTGNALWHAGTLQRVLASALDTGAKGADVADRKDVRTWKMALRQVKSAQARLKEDADKRGEEGEQEEKKEG